MIVSLYCFLSLHLNAKSIATIDRCTRRLLYFTPTISVGGNYFGFRGNGRVRIMDDNHAAQPASGVMTAMTDQPATFQSRNVNESTAILAALI